MGRLPGPGRRTTCCPTAPRPRSGADPAAHRKRAGELIGCRRAPQDTRARGTSWRTTTCAVVRRARGDAGGACRRQVNDAVRGERVAVEGEIRIPDWRRTYVDQLGMTSHCRPACRRRRVHRTRQRGHDPTGSRRLRRAARCSASEVAVQVLVDQPVQESAGVGSWGARLRDRLEHALLMLAARRDHAQRLPGRHRNRRADIR